MFPSSQTYVNTLRSFAVALCLASSGVFLPTLSASEHDDIERAILHSGALGSRTARPAQFLSAITAVFAGADRAAIANEVTIAIQLRPELAARIVAAALRTLIEPQKRPLTQAEIDLISSIVAAAVQQSPRSTAAIVVAAYTIQPAAREQIEAAAGYSLNLAWLHWHVAAGWMTNATDVRPNPSNLDDGDDKKVQSPEKKPRFPRGL